MSVAFFVCVQTAHAELSLTSGTNATTTPNVATAITGFQIVGPAASTTPVKLRATSGTLTLSTVSGVTMSGNNSSTVNLSGTVTNLNTALSTLTYRRNSTGTDTLEVSLVSPSEVFFPDNGHLYEYIASAGTWNAAKTKAEALTRYGATGYLTTILTSSENSFVAARLGGDGWMGASDSASEGDWKWVTGPEAGTSFWSGADGGSIVGGNYANWNSGEPNNSGDEDCAQFYSSTGRWNDLPCGGTSLPGYVAEFGSDEQELTVVAANISIVTADVPAVTSLSPNNGATEVSPATNLVIGFSKEVTVGTGNILIKQVSDNSTVATIDVTSGQITGGGSDEITIDPSESLAEGTNFYVIIPSVAFKDSSNNFFEGIAASTTWAFTTDDETAPILSAIASASVASTSASIIWTTNENASTRLTYGLTASYSTTTAETNTSSRVTSHSVSLTNLLSCTTYHYAVNSRDAASNSATSSDQTFTTAGCAGSTTPTTATSTAVTSSTGGTTSVTENNKSFQVTAPENATATSSSFVIQIKSVPSTSVLNTLGRPSAAPNEVGTTVFDVKAIINGDTVLDSFDSPITITYQYTDAEVVGLDESSLWLYHYHNGAWEALQNCSVNINSNSISCTTDSFSIFGLFGSQTQQSSRTSRGGIHYGCKDEVATNYDYFSAHKQELCEYSVPATTDIATLIQQNRSLFIQAYEMGIALPNYILQILGITSVAAIASTESTDVRDLEYGMTGDDVQKLQLLLLESGYSIPAGATGHFGIQTQYALDAYQVDNAIAPRGGYFGPITREYMKSTGASGVWW